MHFIYDGAFLTICALSGNDSSSGLSGVSRPLEIKPQITLNTESAIYMATNTSHLQESITTSPWNSRCWTFQETVLSTRRLCFHKNGVFLWCRTELFHSSVVLDLSKERELNVADMFNFTCGAFGSKLSHGSWSFREYARTVAAYAPRKLSFDSDTENAIRGGSKLDQPPTRNPFYLWASRARCPPCAALDVRSLDVRSQDLFAQAARLSFLELAWLGR